MRHVIKYLLVLAVLMSGFYMARMFRVPQAADVDVEDMSDEGAAHLPVQDEGAGANAAVDPLPVAALADVDKTAVAIADDLAAFGSGEPGNRMGEETTQSTFARQPTVREQGGTNRRRPQSDGKPRKGNRYDTYSNRSEAADSWDSRSDRDSTETDSDGSRSWMGPETDSEQEDSRYESSETSDSRERARRNPSYDDPLPDFAATYKPWLDPLEESTQPESNPPGSRGGSGSWDDESPGRDEEEGRQDHRHRIVEGDTLRRLAERYLGDRDRYLELYEANETVLFHPRLLPIGIEIVIPGEPDVLAAVDEIDDLDDPTDGSDAWEESSDDTQSAAESEYSTTESDYSPAESPYSPWGDY